MISLHADPTSPAGIGEGGGTHSYVRELLTFFANTDIEILLITRKSHPNLPNYEEISNICKIQRIVIKDEYPIDKKELYSFHNITLQIIEQILKELNFHPNIIHSVYWNSGQVAKEMSVKLKIPYVHTVISNGLRRKMTGMNEPLEQRYIIEKEIFQSATFIFCITPSERMDLVNLYGIDAKKIIVPGRPVSNDFLNPAHDEFGIPYRFEINKEDTTIKSKIKFDDPLNNDYIGGNWWSKRAFLYCGRIGSNKGVDVIIKAWCSLKDIFMEACPALWIVGGSPNEIENLRDDFSNQYNIRKHEQSGELIWWGYLDQRGISTLMLKSHALIMHSSYEPGGRVIIEALSCGIPVIATPCGFGADYIYDWYNGFQVPFGNINFLYYTLSLFVKQPYLSNMLGINAKLYMQKILNEWNFYKSHQKIYNITYAGTNDNFEQTGLISTPQFHKNYINIYPYFNNIITEQELKILLKRELHQDNIQLNANFSEKSAVWITTINFIEYEIWQPYTVLIDHVYYTLNDTRVDKRTHLYERETYTSLLDINPVWEKFDRYYIYIKEKHSILQWQQLQHAKIQHSVQKLLTKTCTYDMAGFKSELIFSNSDWKYSSINEIRDTYETYYKLIPKWFYHSHNINLNLSVRQIYFILTDSHNMHSEDVLTLFYNCQNYLYQIGKTNLPHYGECIENCSLENIVFNHKTAKCMFRSASTLYFGDTSRMIADFLHDYFIFLLSNDDNLSKLDSYVDTFMPRQNEELCIGWLFVITFEKIAFYLNTLQKSLYENEFILLNKLKDAYVEDKETS